MKHVKYVYIFVTGKGRVKRYRHLMEIKLGRSLISGEVVHHINGIKNDDRIENLQLMGKREHDIFHHKLYRHSEKSRHKLSKSLKGHVGRKWTKEQKEKHINRMKGNLYRLGKRHSEKTKNQSAKRMKGNSYAKYNKSWIGRKHSEETKKLMKEIWIKRKLEKEGYTI